MAGDVRRVARRAPRRPAAARRHGPGTGHRRHVPRARPHVRRARRARAARTTSTRASRRPGSGSSPAASSAPSTAGLRCCSPTAPASPPTPRRRGRPPRSTQQPRRSPPRTTRARRRPAASPPARLALHGDTAHSHGRGASDTGGRRRPARRAPRGAASGGPRRRGRRRPRVAAEQTAYGVVVDAATAAPLVGPGEALFMDWRPDHGEPGWPTFLYADPARRRRRAAGGDLARPSPRPAAARAPPPAPRPARPPRHHRRRADARVERVRFPVDRPRHAKPGCSASAPRLRSCPGHGFSVAARCGSRPSSPRAGHRRRARRAAPVVARRAVAVHRLRRHRAGSPAAHARPRPCRASARPSPSPPDTATPTSPAATTSPGTSPRWVRCSATPDVRLRRAPRRARPSGDRRPHYPGLAAAAELVVVCAYAPYEPRADAARGGRAQGGCRTWSSLERLPARRSDAGRGSCTAAGARRGAFAVDGPRVDGCGRGQPRIGAARIASATGSSPPTADGRSSS